MNYRMGFIRIFVVCLISFFCLSSLYAQQAPSDSLKEGFINPPDSAKPWVYWWWLNSFVSKEGITKDLEEMKQKGINGVVIFPAGGGVTPIGKPFMSPEWMEYYKFAIHEAARLKMEASINLCDGWDSGGPWITQDQANKKLVYSEIQIDGQQKISKILPTPPLLDKYYHDVAVVAIKEKPNRPVQPAEITANSIWSGYCDEWNMPPEDIADGDNETFWRANPLQSPSPEKPFWVQFAYHDPLPASSLYVIPDATGGPKECELQSSDDGKQFQSIIKFTMELGKSKKVEFKETTAKYFRVIVLSAHVPVVQIAEAWLLRKGDVAPIRPGIKWWKFKSGNRSFWDFPKHGTAALDEEYPEDGVYDYKPGELIDLSGKMSTDGKLEWEAPEGRWSILRFGYTLQGQRTRCASTSDTGYEADMLSSAGIESQFKNVAEPLLDAVPEETGKTLKYLHIDSYELGADVRGQQPTWSHIFRDEFKARRGYDLLAYLPTMAHRIADSREITNRFFRDYRRTIGDLIADKFFKRYAELAHAKGINVQAETGYGTYPQPHIDGLQCAGMNDVTMGEFWYGTDIMSQFNPFCNVIRTVASAAHIYGKQIIQAESFTAWSHFMEYPYALKFVGDQAFCDGLNRVVIHQYTHQPLMDAKPGNQYGAGTHVDRNLTWWEQSHAWFKYLARCQYLLQQGKFHADICYFYGEGSTKFIPSLEYMKPSIPAGFNFDAINADVLLNRLSVKEGQLILPDGMNYRVMVLPEDSQITLPALSKIKQLMEDGAIVIGSRPIQTPGLTNFPACDKELQQMADALWGKDQAKTGDQKIGKGRLLWGKPLHDIFQNIGIQPDLEFVAPGSLIKMSFTHRSLDGAEAYFISNQMDTQTKVEALFNIVLLNNGKQPELWNPVSGECHSATARAVDNRTSIQLNLAPRQSMIVLFRHKENEAKSVESILPSMKTADTLSGSWTVQFDPKWGGPESVNFDSLDDWTKRPEEGIKYYSGKATYKKSFDLPETLKQAKEIYLDLGKVSDIAEVRLNGQNLGVVWCAPWQVKITGIVKPAGNSLEIDIANLWPNRIIGDAALPEDKRFTKTNVSYGKDTPLLESGLRGPVTLQIEE